MKKLILISCFFLSINSLKAQDVTGIVTGTTFNYQMISKLDFAKVERLE